MKITKRKIQLGWKYRRVLWRYRNLIRHRREIASVAMAAGAMLAAGVLVKRAHRV